MFYEAAASQNTATKFYMVQQFGWETKVRSLALIAGAAALWFILAHADWQRASLLVASVGLLGFSAILVPQSICLLLESWSWSAAFRLLGTKPPFLRLLRIRAGTEALAQSLPVGTMVAEGVTPLLLRDVGVRASITIASQLARRHFLIWSQGLYAALVAVVGFQSLQLLDGPGPIPLGFATALAAVSLLVAAFLLRFVFSKRQVAERLLDWLGRVLWRRAGTWLEDQRPQFIRADEATQTVFSASLGRRFLAATPLLFSWLIETLETWLITHLLGLHWPILLVAGMEVLVALVRHLAFVVPAGLGVQDAGYVLFFHALGAPDPTTTGAAFTLLKRGKELCWIAIGYLVLAPELLKLRLSSVSPSSRSVEA